MDYWKIRENNYVIILLENYIVRQSKGIEFTVPIVTSSYLRDVINGVPDADYIFFDMKNLEKAVSRPFVFLKENGILGKIIFFNVHKGSEVYRCLLNDLDGELEFRKENEFTYFSESAKLQFLGSDIEKIYQKQRADVLKEYGNSKVTFLPSSGVYSNMSLDYKKMFENTDAFQFILSEMYYEICCIKQKFDFLVAASKNAVALAAILGGRLGKPVVYYASIGQKYVRQNFRDKIENQVDAVKQAKKYLMIFDVICLGTEARILNGVINALGGNLIGAVGMVCVQEPENIRAVHEDSILAKANCLTTARKMNLKYRIALTREELEGDSNEN